MLELLLKLTNETNLAIVRFATCGVTVPLGTPPPVVPPVLPDVEPEDDLLGIAVCRKVTNLVEKSQANHTLMVELVAPDRIDAKPPVSGMEQVIDS
jgi:hypothetical protein